MSVKAGSCQIRNDDIYELTSEGVDRYFFLTETKKLRDMEDE